MSCQGRRPASRTERFVRAGKFAIALIFAQILVWSVTAAHAAEAEWIWSDQHKQAEVPAGASCYFRKTFQLKAPEQGQIALNADDAYELYVNGRRVAGGEMGKRLQEFEITRFLVRGTNIIAVKVSNKAGKTAALAARVSVKERNGDWESYSSDATWKSEMRPLPFWNTALYNDKAWPKSQSFGKLGETAPWDRREAAEPTPAAKPAERVVAGNNPTPEATPSAPTEVAAEDTQPKLADRFTVGEDFRVEKVLDGEETGSLIAMTFTEFGHILASQEGGPLLLIHDSDGDKIPDKVKTYCDKVKNCQGILSLNGDVYVTADGEEGWALYRLSDKDRDGELETVKALVKFDCTNPEHGPHGIALGPDGLIYVMVGNHATATKAADPSSPYRHYYDGELLQPKYEDPGGHAVGIKAPGGTVIRTDTEGDGVQVVAGGFRNAYDIAFSRDGELFTHDSDMEADEGTSWYRPTRLLHVLPGGEYGWRSGWGNWPDYFVDTLPSALETGRGSPTGMVTYQHFMYPQKYQGMMFSADWSQGKILAIKLDRDGASWKGSSEVFLEGHPLNVTDIDIGQDGWLYFVTGGRGTSGGVYRVVWKGTVPESVKNLGPTLSAVVRQPQLQSSWARQNIALLRAKIGDDWEKTLLGVARSTANPLEYRRQALEVLQLYGPPPTLDQLLILTEDRNETIRAKAAELLGLQADDEARDRLIALLGDSDRNVRRRACEALLRADQPVSLDALTPLLRSDDRFEATAARRLLERQPVSQWKERALKSRDVRVLIQSGLALMTVAPSRDNGLELLQSVSQALRRFVSDRDFVDLMRVTQVALLRGKILPHDVPGLKQQLAEEFPASDSLMNRELARLLCYLQASNAMDRYLAYLKSDASDIDRLHLALHLRYLKEGWTPQSRMSVLQFYEEAQTRRGGSGYPRYILNVTKDFVAGMDAQAARAVLMRGDELPNAALGALYHLPPEVDEELLQALRKVDQKLAANRQDDAAQRLQVGIVAILARAGDAESMAYLRTAWERDPFRRSAVAMGLAFQPTGDNWPYLVRSLPLLEGNSAGIVLDRLLTVGQAPEDGDFYRYVIVLGLRMKDTAGEKACKLLKFWTGENPAGDDASLDDQLAGWQKWYAGNFPELPEAKLPEAEGISHYKFDELLKHLTGEEGLRGSAKKGAEVFAKANCIKCHRHGDKGESMGPDLTTLTKRFTKRETLESVMFPSYVISSQYAAKKVLTTDGRTLVGIVSAGAAGEKVILQSTGEKISLKDDDIEELAPSKVSAMPAGLLDALSLEEISDLFAFLHANEPAALVRKPK